MRELQTLFTRLKKPRWHASLQQALLGANLDYLRYRFRYLILNNLLATGLHLFEFYLLGLYFNSAQFFSLILLRAFTLIIKNTWWGMLEGLREQVRRYSSYNKRHWIPKEISCWFYSAAVLAAIIFILGILSLWQFFPENKTHSSERFMFYGLAMLIQLAGDMLTRVIHSGIFATQRIYRPWWSIPLAEVLGFMTIMLLLPFARAWCLPISYIVFSFTALYMTWHYAQKAYRLRSQTILFKISWRDFSAWWNRLPLSNILLAGIASAAMSLEGIILWLLQPLIKTDPLLFKLVYLLSPQISAGFDWARMCYFDLKKLHAPKWAIFLPRFYKYLWLCSAVMGVIFWLLGCVTTRLFLPEISIITLLCFLPLFIGRSFLAFCQIKLFAKNHFSTINLGTVFLAVAIILGNFFTPTDALAFISIATCAAIAFSIRPHFKERPIFSMANITPLYVNLERIKFEKSSTNILYMEFEKQLNYQKRQNFLEKISGILGQGNLSLSVGNKMIAIVSNLNTLNKIKAIALGKMTYFQETGWKENGQEALEQAYFLKKKIFNFNETYEAATMTELKTQFLKDFPDALIINLNKPFYNKFKHLLNNGSACSQLVRSISDGWFSAHPTIFVDQYFALFYVNQTGHWMFIAESSKESLPRAKQFQREFWQRNMEYFCSKQKL